MIRTSRQWANVSSWYLGCLCRLQDRDLGSASTNLTELTSQLKIAESTIGDLRTLEVELRHGNSELKKQLMESRRENGFLNGEKSIRSSHKIKVNI